MLKTDPEEIRQSLIKQAETLFGAARAAEIQSEIEVMADQLAVLRITPVDLQDEP